MNREVVGKRVSLITLVLNTILCLIKVGGGIIGHSHVLIADGLHSLSDSITTIGVIIGFKLANKEADECHPYGHEKIESIIAIVLSTILLITAVFIAIEAIDTFLASNYMIPSTYTIYFALLSIIIKEIMYWYTMYYGKCLNSPMLIADAWHHRTDALSSIAALIGIVSVRLFELYIIETLVTLLISIIIIKVAIDIYIQSANEVIDKSASKMIINTINSKLNDIDGIKHIDDLKTRYHVNKIYVEIEIAVDPNLNIKEAHDIAEEVHYEIEKINKSIKHCTVHVNPYFDYTFH